MRFRILFLFFVISSVIGVAQVSDPVAAFNSKSKIAPLHSYKGTQQFECSGTSKSGKTATGGIENSVELSPEGELSSRVTSEKGSKYITSYLRLFVVGKRPNAARSDFTDTNYEITYDGVVVDEYNPSNTLIRLRLKPRRKEGYLIDGFIFIDQSDGDMVRVEGIPAKHTAFTSNVRIIRHYKRIAGIRVPTKMTLTASISVPFVISNASTSLVVHYYYSEINGIAVR